ncbi:hypothetical protein GQX73_g6348 [Xylaria multiplex]|uniref:Cytochrome P450 n=1 Tax=Xylaria multiplex TaxID=323545 RepID=A0A7C8MNB4_9PEZI|nr:hypothetical protein GQX73_g6348 [Xylaria multiplex]
MRRDQSQLPIVTLPLFGSRVYVVFSVPIIQSIQKQHKLFAFQPIQAKFSTKLCGASKDAYKILRRHIHEENGEFGTIYGVMHHALCPGKFLDEMNFISSERVRSSIDGIRPGTNIKLGEWLRHHVTLATTDAVYGPHNPFREKEVENAFWAFDEAIPGLIFLPQCVSRQWVRNRKVVADAFRHYFLHGYHEYASALLKDFYQAECSYGFSLSDRSLFETGHAIATLDNTYTAVFWLIFYVFSSSSALQKIRHEVASIITASVGKVDGKRTARHVVDITKVNSHCPFLVSTFKETMRLHGIGISIRQVCKDTILDNTYCLKKGAMIIMPTISVHTDSRIWGPDALSFKYDRFFPDKATTTRGNKVSPAAFRSFGGGTTMCPGRHFATTQIMVWISILVMRYNIEPTSGSWNKPAAGKPNMANAIMRPDHDIEVNFNPRDYYSDGIWEVKVANPDEISISTTDSGVVGDRTVQWKLYASHESQGA